MISETKKLWKKNNPEKLAEYKRKFRSKPGIKKRESLDNHIWHVRNRDKYNARMRQWRKDNPLKAKTHDDNKKAKRLGAKGSHTLEQWLSKVAFFGWRCVYCKKELTQETLTKEHMLPLVRGGSNWVANLAPACQHCNATKRHKTPAEFARWKGETDGRVR